MINRKIGPVIQMNDDETDGRQIMNMGDWFSSVILPSDGVSVPQIRVLMQDVKRFLGPLLYPTKPVH